MWARLPVPRERSAQAPGPESNPHLRLVLEVRLSCNRVDGERERAWGSFCACRADCQLEQVKALRDLAFATSPDASVQAQAHGQTK